MINVHWSSIFGFTWEEKPLFKVVQTSSFDVALNRQPTGTPNFLMFNLTVALPKLSPERISRAAFHAIAYSVTAVNKSKFNTVAGREKTKEMWNQTKWKLNFYCIPYRKVYSITRVQFYVLAETSIRFSTYKSNIIILYAQYESTILIVNFLCKLHSIRFYRKNITILLYYR